MSSNKHTNTFVRKGVDENEHHGITKQFSIIFSSATANYNSPNMDKFSVTLNNPISVPKEANSCDVALYSANIWNSSPNIITSVNDVFSFIVNGVPASVIIPEGLYSLPEFNQTIAQLVGPNKFEFSGNTATQKVQIEIAANYQIDFTQPLSQRDILGYNSQVVPPLISPVIFTSTAPNIAAFNNVNAFLVTLDTLNDGLPVNAKANSILSQVPIIAPSNSLIYYEPASPIWIQCDHIIGKQISQINVGITNELGLPIKVREDWAISVSFRYQY